MVWSSRLLRQLAIHVYDSSTTIHASFRPTLRVLVGGIDGALHASQKRCDRSQAQEQE